MAEFDVSRYLGLFLDEAEEQLQELDEGLVRLEQSKEDTNTLNRVFRAVHTLKGSAASMGFDKMAQVTHHLEDVLDRLRRRELELTTEVMDVMLECVDVLRALKQSISSGKEGGVGVESTVSRLKKILEVAPVVACTATGDACSVSGLELDEVEQNVLRAALETGYAAYEVTVTLEPDCLMKAARAFIVFNNLWGLGEVIKTVPSTEEIEAEQFDRTFALILVTKADEDTVRRAVTSTSEIESVAIKALSLPQEVEPVGTAEKQSFSARALEGKAESKVKRLTQTVRVDVRRLENLMNLVGELVIDRTRLMEIGSNLKSGQGSDALLETLEEVSVHIGRVTGDLQEEIMKARMFPVEQVFSRFPRMVRDLAVRAGKEIEFIIEGRETELDRTVIEEISDPLIHLLRNAIDHGIEKPEERVAKGKPRQGTIKLRAFHQEGQIVITVEDDGQGMDPVLIKEQAVRKGLISPEAAGRLNDREALDLIFLPGFSTAGEVSDVSGRGVGMDIVRAHIERINGTVDIATAPGRGTCFTIRLPLTLAINRSLLVCAGGQVYAFPLANVVEIISVSREDVKTIHGRQVTVVRGEVLPLLSLAEVLGWGEGEREADGLSIVVVSYGDRRIGFTVDSFLGEQEIVIKSLGEYVGQVPGIAGATIMGDGRVALILDVRGLVSRAERNGALEYAS